MDQRHNWFLLASGVKKLQYRKNPEMYSQLRQTYKFKYSLDVRFRAMAHSISMGTRHNAFVFITVQQMQYWLWEFRNSGAAHTCTLQHEHPANSTPKYYVYA